MPKIEFEPIADMDFIGGTDEPYNPESYGRKARSLGVTEAGEILSVRITCLHTPQEIILPKKLLDQIGKGRFRSEKKRRGLADKLHANSPNPFPITGKPSSAFILRNSRGITYLDYLLEDPLFRRPENRTLHSYMVDLDNAEHADRYHPASLWDRQSMWSGHVAGITDEFRNDHFHSIYLLDKFGRMSDLECITEADRRIIADMYRYGLIPVTGDGRIIERQEK